MKETVELLQNVWVSTRIQIPERLQSENREWSSGSSWAYPSLVRLEYAQKIERVTLFRNTLPENVSKLFKEQPYREYFYIGDDDPLMLSIVTEICIGQMRWIIEAKPGGNCQESIFTESGIRAVPIGSVYTGDSSPRDLAHYAQFMEEAPSVLYGQL
ncbi:hypothetical protein [Brevibacillus brevis]|uniref:hypothetical protein n=1 Tax=Brevibacillus brevis TaxID=1393 RepID=UPI0037C81106